MADAWGGSWGSSWASSWGAGVVVVTRQTPGGNVVGERRRSKRTGKRTILVYRDEAIEEVTETPAERVKTKPLSPAVVEAAIAQLPGGMLNPGDVPDLPDSFVYAGPAPSRIALIDALTNLLRRQIEQASFEAEDEEDIELLLTAA